MLRGVARSIRQKATAQRAVACGRRQASTTTTKPKERVLITGALGQIGSELAGELKKRGHFVIATDVRPPPPALAEKFGRETPFHYLDVSSAEDLRRLVVEERATMILHLSAKLSATAEKDPGGSFGVNVRAVENVLETARHYGLKVYAPSSIAAFGPSTPNLHSVVDDITIQRPLNVYGVSKVYLEVRFCFQSRSKFSGPSS
jgi:nucleoside-diphosphate-sugar epimerase